MKKSDKTLFTFIAGALAGGAIAYFSQTEKGKKLTKEVTETAQTKYEESLKVMKKKKEEVEENFKNAMEELDLKELERKGKAAISNLTEKIKA